MSQSQAAPSTRRRKVKNETIEPVSNGAATTVSYEQPYNVSVTLRGVCPLLYHRYNSESVAEKASAKKGSRAKKEDDVESYVYRLTNGELAMPGTWLYGAVTGKKGGAAKFRQDPRSPRKSARDLYEAGFIVTTELSPLGNPTKEWDFIHREPVVVQQSRILRERPALLAGWECTYNVMIVLPEYISPVDVYDVVALAGKICGLGDHRPTYGRFQLISFDTEVA